MRLQPTWRKPKRLDVAELASFTSAVKLAGLNALPVGSPSRAAMAGTHFHSCYALQSVDPTAARRWIASAMRSGRGGAGDNNAALRLSIHLPIVRDAAVLVIDGNPIGVAHSMTQPIRQYIKCRKISHVSSRSIRGRPKKAMWSFDGKRKPFDGIGSERCACEMSFSAPVCGTCDAG
jgi:hypothetical protein